MPGLLDGKTAVVTGAASGIGRKIAVRFAEEGANVVVADIQEDPREGGTPTADVVGEMDVESAFVKCDVTKLSQIEAAIDAADEMGGVDVMVNNAGIFWGKEFTEVTEEDYDRLMDINLKGVFFGSQYAAKKMVDDGGGSIINMSSVAGITGSANYVTYCASKGGVRLMTYALASELGPDGIRVNVIHPGIIETEMTSSDVAIVGTEAGEGYKETVPLHRFGKPKDIADGAVYLASDLASYVNGESLIIDGGMTFS